MLPKRLIYQSDLASVPENRTLMDSVTACSGSGIAYVSVCMNIHTNVQEEIK